MEASHKEAVESENKRRFRRICVFCGSRPGNSTSFSDATLELGKQLVRNLEDKSESKLPTGFIEFYDANFINLEDTFFVFSYSHVGISSSGEVKRKIDLVYGGGSVGLMGLISQVVYDGGCHVLGVIPKALLPPEILGETIGEEKTVADMHERKSEMAKHADAFIALPGGYGTMEELLEIIAWSQLGIHDKPVGLLNVDGYYDSLLALFDKGVKEGFIEESARHIVVSADSAEELIRKMEANEGEKRKGNTSLKRKRSCES